MKELKGPGLIYRIKVKRKSKYVRKTYIKDGKNVLMWFAIPANEKWQYSFNNPIYYVNNLTYDNYLTIEPLTS